MHNRQSHVQQPGKTGTDIRPTLLMPVTERGHMTAADKVDFLDHRLASETGSHANPDKKRLS
jgi:hypothetical protein